MNTYSCIRGRMKRTGIRMFNAHLPLIGTAAAWREAARRGLSNRIHPDTVCWLWNSVSTDPDALPLPRTDARKLRLPRQLLDLTDAVIWHRDPSRFDLAYRLLWRFCTDPKSITAAARDLEQLRKMQTSVFTHQRTLKRNLRFLSISGQWPFFVAICDPVHPTLEPIIPYFANRFRDLNWLIVTPDIAAFGQSGIAGSCARSDLPDWAASTAAEVEMRAAETRINPSRHPRPTTGNLFPEPLPLHPRPDQRAHEKPDRKQRSRVLHESRLGAEPAAE